MLNNILANELISHLVSITIAILLGVIAVDKNTAIVIFIAADILPCWIVATIFEKKIANRGLL